MQIYLNEIFKQLGLLFYKKIKEKKEFVFSIYNVVSYHISKFTTKFCLQGDF